MVRFRLRLDPSRVDTFAGPIPPGTCPGWYLLVLRAGKQPKRWLAVLELSAPDAPVQEMQLMHPSARWLPGVKLGIVYVMGPADRAEVQLRGARWVPDTIDLRLRPISPALAALGALLQNTSGFLASFGVAAGSWRRRARKALAASATNGQRLPEGYAGWLLAFDSWSDRRLETILAALPGRPAIQALVFGAGRVGPALAATLASLRTQSYPASSIDVVRPGDAMPIPTAPFTVVLQAGETLAPQALLLLLRALSGPDAAYVAYADEDRLRADGSRFEPSFKPEPGLMMMCSGLLSRGAWLMRSDLLPRGRTPDWAEFLRLQAWFDLSEAGQGSRVRRVAVLLTHRREDAEAAPPQALAAVVDAGLRRLGLEAEAVAGFPLRLDWDTGGRRTVDVIVPSRLRGAIQLSCLLDVAGRTTYPHFSMLVVVTQDGPLDEAQLGAARHLESSGKARVELLRRARFNYSAANNYAASLTGGELICLLNDDVSLIGGEWLGQMAAMFSDPKTGIVGAKLYYPDGRTQHGGIIMGLGGLALHVHRFLARGEPGYMGRALLDQEMSAVTGACLMVRRSLFERVGGLDEGLPFGFNDVDFCLRIRTLGYSVIMAGSVELVHHETISFGHHYNNDIEAELVDARLMQRRWPEVIAADPYHNPNLSLLPDAEWTLAAPPRGEPACGSTLSAAGR